MINKYSNMMINKKLRGEINDKSFTQIYYIYSKN